MQPYVWWRRTAVAFALLAASLPFAARALVGPRGAIVHVRWQSSITERLREDLEARFRLADGEKLDEYTWRYDLIDPSRENIRALLIEPAVADTHNIDRPNNALDPSANRTARRQRFPVRGDWVVTAVDRLAITLAAFAALLTLVGTTGWTPAPGGVRLRLQRMRQQLSRLSQALAAPVVQFVQRGIPDVDAGTAGIFRIVFGVAVLVFFVSHPVDAGWLNATFDLEIEGPVHAAVLEWLRGRPLIADLLMPWLFTMGMAFTVGIFTRVTYALFVAGVLVWAYVAVSLASTHPHSILLLTLVALLPSRWGDARSADSWLRRIRGRESAARPAGRQYGYSVWVPGLAFGVALAAAAWAKLSVPPGWTSWILNGTVKYHFISDSVNAPVDWGLQLARHPLLAILASLGAIATEALVVTAAFTRNEWYRLVMGAFALALLIGFELFMGVFWPGWWVPLLAFLPWERLCRLKPAPTTVEYVGAGLSRPEGRALTAAQLAVIAGVIAQQVVASALTLERAPMFSWYDMYSGTYASPAAFNASRPPSFRIVATTDRGRAELRCDPHEEFVREYQAALAGSPTAKASVWRALRGCGDDLADVRDVTLEGDIRTFDWDRLEFTSARSAVVLGPLAAHTGESTAIRP